MEEETVIKVENVSKDFLLPHEKTNSVKNIFTSSISNRSKKVEVQHALKNISFEVKKGEFFGVIGRNGSGKSTLLKILASIYQPTKGSVSVKGKLVPFIELGVGFQPELTGKENVYLNGAMLGFSEKEVAAMYKDIVAFAELEKFMDQKLKNYSSGMQVRLAFSMATRSQADILLIDEVLAVGDADFQRKCFNYFSQLKNEKVTVVFISHDMSAIREYCNRSMLIENNEIVQIGATDNVTQQYLKLFIDEETTTTAISSDENRWGDKSLRIKGVESKITPDQIIISYVVKASKDFVRPIAGIRVRDASGNEITGSNTKHEKINLSDLKKGESINIEWSMPNILRDGKYAVDIALQYPDEITVADWWNDATTLVINKERHIPYTIDPGFKVKIS